MPPQRGQRVAHADWISAPGLERAPRGGQRREVVPRVLLYLAQRRQAASDQRTAAHDRPQERLSARRRWLSFKLDHVLFVDAHAVDLLDPRPGALLARHLDQ